jgi:hypothetical protein
MTSSDAKDLAALSMMDAGELRDAAALKMIHTAFIGRLSATKATATSWVAGLTALAGVLGAATVVTTDTKMEDLDEGVRQLIALFIVGSAALVTLGLVLVYAASNSSPLGGSKGRALKPYINGTKTDAADAAWDEAVEAAATRAKVGTIVAVIATVLGAALAASAVVATWFPPDAANAEATVTCVLVGDTTLKFEGALPALPSVLAGQYAITPCS